MKNVYFLIVALILSISSVQAGLDAEFSVANADGVMISYAKCESWPWYFQCEGNGLIVSSWREYDMVKYADEVLIPETVVHEGITYSVIGIAPYAFSNENCTDLKSVSVPGSVYYIDSEAFLWNSTLTDIYVEWSDPAAVLITPGVNFENLTASNITLHVPVGKKSLYENDDVWKNFNIVDDVNTVYNTAKLTNLAVSAGALSPAFNPSQYSYTVTVPLSVANITLTATPTDGCMVSGDGQKLLNTGENNFSLVVASADGAMQSTYTVKVIRLEIDAVFELIATNYSSSATAANPVTGGRLDILNRQQLTYRITTGNLSGDVPLHFNAGGKTLNRTISLQPNHIYEMNMRILIDIEIIGSISITVNYNAYGQPSSATVNYNYRGIRTVTVSNNGLALHSSETEMMGNPKSIEFLGIEAKGTLSSIARTDAEPARPIGYYSITGQKLNREPAGGIYIIKYDSGIHCAAQLEIIGQYNSEIAGFYNYYSIANQCERWQGGGAFKIMSPRPYLPDFPIR